MRDALFYGRSLEEKKDKDAWVRSSIPVGLEAFWDGLLTAARCSFAPVSRGGRGEGRESR